MRPLMPSFSRRWIVEKAWQTRVVSVVRNAVKMGLHQDGRNVKDGC